MKQIGLYALIFGGGSMLLNLFGYQFRLLSWIDNWGEGVGWGIRIGLVVLGAALFLLGKPKEEEIPASSTAAESSTTAETTESTETKA